MITNLARGIEAFTSNAFLVTGDRPVVIDVGANFDVVSQIRNEVGALDAVILTHTHPDHVGNLDAVADEFDIPVSGYDTDHPGVDREIADEETLRLGDHEYVALHTPGHKDDHLCFFSRDNSVLFAGDLIFQNGGFGRTDLDEGDRDRLIESIDRVAAVVGDDLETLHCGHGPSIRGDATQHVALAARMARQY